MINILIFGEFVSSNDFFLLLSRSWSIVNNSIGLGTYMQGLPIPNNVDFVWGTNSGVRTLPILSFLALLQKIFSSNWSYMYLAISIVLPFLTFLAASRIGNKLSLFSILGALLYGGNLWIINRIFTGFWQLNLAYAFLPFLIVIPLKIITFKNISSKEYVFWSGLYALFASFVLISQPHFIIITGLFSLLHLFTLFARREFMVLKNLFLFYLTAIIIFFCINAYFFIPGILYPERLFTASNQYFSIAAVIFNGQGNQIEHILRFDALGFSQAKFSWTWIEYLQLIPIAFFFAMFLLNKNKNYVFLTLVIIFIFFAKGVNEPGGDISRWIYQNIFFMHYFRDPSRFLAGVALFSALSINSSVIKIKLIKKMPFAIILSTLVVFLLINIKSIQRPKVELLNKTTIPEPYSLMQNYINTKIADENSRLLVIPNTHGIAGYSWYKNSSPISANTIFDAVLPLRTPLANSSNYPDSYSNQVSAYIYNEYTKTYDPKLLSPLGVKYLLVDSSIVQPEPEREIANKSNDLLNNDKRYRKIKNYGPLTLFKLNTPSPLISSESPIFTVGNLSTVARYYEQSKTRPIVLLNQVVNNSLIDMEILKSQEFFRSIDDSEFILTSENLSNEYSVDILNVVWDYDKLFTNYEPYKMKYIKEKGELFTSGRAVAAQANGFMHVEHDLQPGRYIILIKSLTEYPSALSILAGNNHMQSILDSNKQLLWKNLGIISIDSTLSNITLTKGDKNLIIIDQLLFVPEEVYRDKLKTIKDLLNNMSKSNRKYVKYFTQNISYGDHWSASNLSAKYISNGYGMTFVSDGGDINKITYTPEKTYKYSLAMSVISLISTLLFCSYMLTKKTKLLSKAH